MKKELIVGLVLFLGLAVVVLYLNQNFLQKNKPVIKIETTQSENMPIDNSTPLTSTEVAKHNSATDCWVIVDGMIYDLSKFLEIHPGGKQVIIGSCGADGSRVFNTRGDRGPHPDSAKEKLAEFLVGELAK